MMKTFRLFLMLFIAFGFSIAAEEAAATVKVLTKTTKSWNGEILPRYSRGKPELTILRISIPPHTELSWHKHPVINAGFMISGKLTVITDQEDTLFLTAGDPIIEVVDTWHFGMNEGDEPVDIVVFYAGVKNKEITILK